LKTKKGYILMNFHGPNRPRLPADKAVNVAPLLKEALAIHANEAKILGMNLNKLIITCDSNDRAHGINVDEPLVLAGVKFSDGHRKDAGAKSCCYNYDSCGIDVAPGGNPQAMEIVDEKSVGGENEYKYTGDYALGANPVTLTAVSSSPYVDDYGASTASDHKMVVAVLNLPKPSLVGGRRSTKKKSKSKSKKQRKTRSQKQKQ
jgi:hypothetical protein